MKYFLGLKIVLFAMNLQAAQINVLARFYKYSCGYFSNQTADLQIFLSDVKLPNGQDVPADAVVLLKYGLGNNVDRDWEKQGIIVTHKEGLSNVRVANIITTINERSSPAYYDKVQFMWVILHEGGPSYVKGNSSKFGFYESNFVGFQQSPCTEPGKVLPEYNSLKTHTVEREHLW